MSVLDRAVAAAVVRAGAPGRIRFTRRQLYYEVCRGLLPVHRLPRTLKFTLPAPVGYARFLAALERHGPVPGLLEEPAERRTAPRDDVPDLYDYGLPRLLVCQDAGIAGMLLANELHMESACPVFALRDLPLDPRLAEALRRTGDAAVYVLHDASRAGYAAVEDVRAWAGDLRVHPLGLRPVHAAALHLTTAPRERSAAGSAAAPAGLALWELRRLRAGRSVEVAAVNPARLLRTVHRLVRGQTRHRRRTARLRQLQAAGFMTWPAA
ncbi:hypothetical protein Daura_33540 [Dactylosporangium aurantiacum]|uniref:Uncharacterized protein n=1 Tax=Dactylosporangium aurantiacum TaxID=35754 RepID=A0A9Q9IEB8_9ACTN|nr:hypothetical protein [Dactylosporangium aurantiacum]MDG6105118.1 hypothetical protein [Dactylosporangium aurantiacum]UWZ51643.1 hypothetical protein Daura_33540 [Dactylosporangium aurantiacum]